METTSATQSAQSALSAVTPPAADDASGAVISSDFQTFLTMLTVQLENQDPLNPLQSSDFAVQLATFSGVEQQVQTNRLLQEMTGQRSLAGLSDIAGWVGMEARAPVAAAYDGTPVSVFPNIPPDADQATLIVRDSSGQVISRSAMPVSSDPILWGGTDATGAPVPPGAYRFEVEARSGGEMIAIRPAEVFARITEARLDDRSPVVVFVAGDSIAATDVTAVRTPGA